MCYSCNVLLTYFFFNFELSCAMKDFSRSNISRRQILIQHRGSRRNVDLRYPNFIYPILFHRRTISTAIRLETRAISSGENVSIGFHSRTFRGFQSFGIILYIKFEIEKNQNVVVVSSPPETSTELHEFRLQSADIY